MGNPNVKPSEAAVLAGVIDPDAYAAAAYSTGWVSMIDYDAIQAIVQVGTIAATGTVDAKLEQASDGSGTGAKDITGKAITQLTQAGGDSDQQAIINCRSDELDVANAFTHVRLTVTLGTAGADMGALVLGHYARYAPETDLASVVEVV
ncbi:MAG: hypothetical protein C4570_03400 [Ammonifex sp.]|jgi:hypothetical protein|nr:MAG: hypothetical protein C4570_03400 [Ammonifex sp.]